MTARNHHTQTPNGRVVRLIRAQHTVEGDGFVVRRPFPTASLSHIDPFLLFDHMGPADFEPGRGVGTPWHPHRGFETVTYLLEGDMEHRDSMGNHGFMHSGDTQWMTAGAGVLHKEGPSADAQRDGGRTHGLQLWVNLPAAEKMTAPAYQDLRAEPNARPRPSRAPPFASSPATCSVSPGRAARARRSPTRTSRSPLAQRSPLRCPPATWCSPTR